jgi:hypothetical protein
MVQHDEQQRDVTPREVKRIRRAALRALLLFCLLGWPNGFAQALIVGNHSGALLNTTVNPANFGPPWTKGDPGFNNFSLNSGYVYLGDGWVLSARHVGYNATAGVTFQTANGPVTYKMAGATPAPDGGNVVPGAYYSDYGFNSQWIHVFAVSNPNSVQLENGQTQTLSPFTDLQLFRINGDPGLPKLTIASQPLPNDFTDATASEVMIMGNSEGRSADETHWDISGSTWTPTTGAGNKQGFNNDGVLAKRWGTNRVADPANMTGQFSGILSNTAGVIPLNTALGATTRDVIGNSIVYNASNEAGATPFEAQAIDKDSGGAVFHKRNGTQWELTGIVSANATYEGQPTGTAVYGNVTLFSDLSYYNQNYLNSIKYIIDTHPDYSVMGDVNLDGVVSGNGTGPASSDDISAFVAGWRWNNGTEKGTVTSWSKGDLNRDGKVSAVDFFKLRQAFVAAGSWSPSVNAITTGRLGIAAPEPSTALLVLLAGSCLISARRRKTS